MIWQAQPPASPGWVLLVFGLLTALGGAGGIAAVLYARQTGRKLNAEAHKYGVDADVALSGQALEWLKETHRQAAQCRAEVDALRRHVGVLEARMRQQGISAPPFVWPRDDSAE